MPAPVAYTEAELAAFMVAALDSVATDLGLISTSTSILKAVTAVERLLGVSDVATVTDMPKLEALATWKAWQVAYSAAVTKADEIKAGSAGLKWGDRLSGLQAMLCQAEQAAMVYPEARAALGGAIPMPYAGGLSRSDKATRESNTDRVRPFFTRRLHEPIGGR